MAHNGKKQLRAISKEDLKFALDNELSGRQLYALSEIGEYYGKYPELKDKPTIFAFEGLGSYSGGVNSYHPNGQYGALIIVAKGGKLVYATANASTLPDNPVSATVNGGVYQTIYKFHSGTYAALQVRNLETGADGIDACYHESQGI